MDDYSKLSASDGTGEAVVANIENDRAPAAVTLDVDNVDNWPTEFICVTGTLNPNNYIDNSSMTIFYGHIDAGNIVIDSFAPGYTDVGNTAGQIAIIKPTTEWVNQVVELAMVAHQDNGKLKTTSLDEFYKPSEISATNFIVSGGVWTGDSYATTRAASMTALVCYINGLRGSISAVTARLFTASKDTYVDVLNTAGVFSLVYTEVANGAASPALAANSLRLAKIVTDATDIQSASSITQSGFDSLGNQINQVAPISTANFMPRAFGVVGATGGNFTTTSATYVDVTGITTTYITGNTPETLYIWASAMAQNSTSVSAVLTLSIGGTDQVDDVFFYPTLGGEWYITSKLYVYNAPANTSVTIKMRAKTPGGTLTVNNSATFTTPKIQGFAVRRP